MLLFFMHVMLWSTVFLSEGRHHPKKVGRSGAFSTSRKKWQTRDSDRARMQRHHSAQTRLQSGWTRVQPNTGANIASNSSAAFAPLAYALHPCYLGGVGGAHNTDHTHRTKTAA